MKTPPVLDATVRIPLAEAALCVACDLVFAYRAHPQVCPGCAEPRRLFLSAVMNRQPSAA